MRFFNQVTLSTPESVELEFTLAGIGNRALALMIDYLVWGSILIVVLFTWGILSTQIPANIASQFGAWAFAITLLLTFFIYVGYFVFFETLWQGQTPGKRFVKIRVIQDNGKPIGIQQATLRALLRPIDDTFSLGAIFIVFNAKEKRLGDWVAGTIVVQEERRSNNPDKFVISDQAQAIANQLLEEADVTALLPDDFAVIKEYLKRRKDMEPSARLELSRKLGKQLKELISLETVPPQVSSELFLEAVYLAYQQQN
ncbi:putative membrane protein/domain protein [Synechococcus sp. PCC 7502]|uniref:RDD family protein n=1 Tax=Synechococcus sp. PCC 7502 TaxID=1173263 RepID=UPI00029FE94A|nr:RDD family protein [Synechococcus sp. PCC 7502]AFY74216.1 putative membrane protein/domain protein [Synechococcus sp. PCC 7502]